MQTPSKNQIQNQKEFHTPSCIIQNKEDIYNFLNKKNTDIQRIYESYILNDFKKNDINVENFHIDAATTKRINILKQIFNNYNMKYKQKNEEIEVDIFGTIENIPSFMKYMKKSYQTKWIINKKLNFRRVYLIIEVFSDSKFNFQNKILQLEKKIQFFQIYLKHLEQDEPFEIIAGLISDGIYKDFEFAVQNSKLKLLSTFKGSCIKLFCAFKQGISQSTIQCIIENLEIFKKEIYDLKLVSQKQNSTILQQSSQIQEQSSTINQLNIRISNLEKQFKTKKIKRK